MKNIILAIIFLIMAVPSCVVGYIDDGYYPRHTYRYPPTYIPSWDDVNYGRGRFTCNAGRVVVYGNIELQTRYGYVVMGQDSRRYNNCYRY